MHCRSKFVRRAKQRGRCDCCKKIPSRIRRPSGEVRWCIGSAAASVDGSDRVIRVSGVTIDVSDRQHRNPADDAMV
jgi:hypothetical protein